MKKLFIAGLLALTLITSAFATPANTTKAMAHFSHSFADAKSVSWKSTDKFEKVSFILNNEKVEVYYDKYGEMIGTIKVMAFDKLPKSALETLTTQYTFPEYRLTDCISFTNTDDETKYFVSFEAKNGTIMLEITKGGSVSAMKEMR